LQLIIARTEILRIVKRVSKGSSTMTAINTALKNGASPKDLVSGSIFVSVKNLDE
jgi:hypothetical protein